MTFGAKDFEQGCRHCDHFGNPYGWNALRGFNQTLPEACIKDNERENNPVDRADWNTMAGPPKGASGEMALEAAEAATASPIEALEEQSGTTMDATVEAFADVRELS